MEPSPAEAFGASAPEVHVSSRAPSIVGVFWDLTSCVLPPDLEGASAVLRDFKARISAKYGVPTVMMAYHVGIEEDVQSASTLLQAGVRCHSRGRTAPQSRGGLLNPPHPRCHRTRIIRSRWIAMHPLLGP